MRLLLSGYYGLGNLGDEAILAGLAPALAARGVAVTVLSAAPRATSSLHSVAAVHRLRGVPVALVGHTAFVSGGGGLLQDATSSRSLGYYLGLIRAAKALGKRVAVYGQSLGPLTHAGRKRVAAALAGVPLAVRDRQSLAIAADLGLQAELVGDPALLMSRPKVPETPSAPGAPTLLIPRGGHPRFDAPLERLAAALIADGERVAAMALQPRVDDGSVAALLAALPSLERAAAETPKAALDLIAKAAAVVSVRLHGCILAAVAGVPFVALAYDPKVAGFAELAGAEVVPPEATAGELQAALARARPLSDYRRAALLASAEHGVNWLVNAIGPVRGSPLTDS